MDILRTHCGPQSVSCSHSVAAPARLAPQQQLPGSWCCQTCRACCRPQLDGRPQSASHPAHRVEAIVRTFVAAQSAGSRASGRGIAAPGRILRCLSATPHRQVHCGDKATDLLKLRRGRLFFSKPCKHGAQRGELVHRTPVRLVDQLALRLLTRTEMASICETVSARTTLRAAISSTLR